MYRLKIQLLLYHKVWKTIIIPVKGKGLHEHLLTTPTAKAVGFQGTNKLLKSTLIFLYRESFYSCTRMRSHGTLTDVLRTARHFSKQALDPLYAFRSASLGRFKTNQGCVKRQTNARFDWMIVLNVRSRDYAVQRSCPSALCISPRRWNGAFQSCVGLKKHYINRAGFAIRQHDSNARRVASSYIRQSHD